MSHVEYEITILAYYRDGTRSDPVSLRYIPSRWPFLHSDGLGTGAAQRGPRLLDLHARDLILPLASRLPEFLRPWAGPLDPSPQRVQALEVAEVQIPQQE